MHLPDTWLKARREYVEGKGFIPHIASKYDIPVSTVQTRAKREKWATARAEFIARKTKMPEVELPPTPAGTNSTSYLPDRLMRVRAQLDRIDEMILTETDGKVLQALATATAKLAEQERILGGRPLPGALRPVERKANAVCGGPVMPLD